MIIAILLTSGALVVLAWQASSDSSLARSPSLSAGQ